MPTYKIYKICQFVGLKKKEVTTIVCVFLRKAPTKNSKRTSKCQVFSFTVPKKNKSWTELAKRAPFRIFQHRFGCKISKHWREVPLKTIKMYKEKSLTLTEKTERGTFSTGILCYAEKRRKFYISVPCAKWSNLAPKSFV